MSIETQLRDALTSHAGSIESVEANPYERVSAAVGRNRRRRRAAAATTIAAIAAIAFGVPLVSSRLSNETLPTGQGQLPNASDTAWNSVTTWPLRGALASDGPLVDAVQDKFNGRAVFVEDVDTRRVALIVRGDQLIIAAGPRGAAGQALSRSTQVLAPTIREDSLLSLGAGSSLVIVTTPDRTSAEVSGTPDIALDGTVTRSWAKLPLTGGIGRTALSPLTHFRLGSFVGSVQHHLTEVDSTFTPCNTCDLSREATEEAETTAHIALMLGLDATQIDTTTAFSGEVPRDPTSVSTTSGTPSLHVMHSRLPGGQVLRTAWIRTLEGKRAIEEAQPIDARRAAAVPLVIGATGDFKAGPTHVRVFVASGTSLRAVSDSSTSAVIPITGHLATFTRPGPPSDFWNDRLEILDGGRSLGTFPTTISLDTPFEVGS